VKVLVAEDDPITSHLLQALLVKAGYETVLVGDGSEVLEALDRPDGPRLVILDWMMPRMDGLEVCRRVRKTGSDNYVYLIFLTAKEKQEEIIEGLEAGADDYITKPFDFHELMARLSTGSRLLNREAILDVLQKELTRGLRSRNHLGVIMADIDHFKGVNDTQGHLAGDIVLREVARRMLGSLRSYDSLGRYGGEEFLIVAPGCDLNQTAQLADRLRSTVSNTRIDSSGYSLAVTLSFGVADISVGQKPDEILRAADMALYTAKKCGRDRVETCSEINVVGS
jgi:two-component system cell cycle response regulator